MLLLCFVAALEDVHWTRRSTDTRKLTSSATDRQTASSDGVSQCSITRSWETTGSFTPAESQNIWRSIFLQFPLPLVYRKERVWPYVPLAKSTLQSKQNSSGILLSHSSFLFLHTNHYLGYANATLTFCLWCRQVRISPHSYHDCVIATREAIKKVIQGTAEPDYLTSSF